MGYIKHNAIVVTSWDYIELKKAHDKANEIFANAFKEDSLVRDGSGLVSEIIHGIANTQDSFFIAPDGSKEGWSPSNSCDDARKEFLDWLLKNENYSDYVEIRFGGDDDSDRIVRSKDTDLKSLAEESY